MSHKRTQLIATSFLVVVAVTTIWFFQHPNKSAQFTNLTDEALLALIKNDQKAFESFIAAGGDVHGDLPEIDGTTYTVAQGISYFERPNFAQFLNNKGIQFVKQDGKAPFDIMTIAVKKNNPDLFKELLSETTKFQLDYGKNAWTLLHMASAWCSDKLTPFFEGKINWDHKALDGTTPLTLAAVNDCLPMLSYWKEKGADFRAKDGRGQTALSILKKKKDAALAAFAASFEERKVATVTVVKKLPVPDFYKKRKIPKEQIVDHAAMLEPEDRPLGATETAEFSEFAD